MINAQITNIADFRKNLSLWLTKVENQKPVVVVRHGRPVVVIQRFKQDKIKSYPKKNLTSMIGDTQIPDFDVKKMNRYLREARYGK